MSWVFSAASAAMAFAAAQDTSTSLYGWRLDRRLQEGASFCLLSHRREDGILLMFARSASNPSMTKVGFASPNWPSVKPGQSYEIEVDLSSAGRRKAALAATALSDQGVNYVGFLFEVRPNVLNVLLNYHLVSKHLRASYNGKLLVYHEFGTADAFLREALDRCSASLADPFKN